METYKSVFLRAEWLKEKCTDPIIKQSEASNFAAICIVASVAVQPHLFAEHLPAQPSLNLLKSLNRLAGHKCGPPIELNGNLTFNLIVELPTRTQKGL
jgi:hypothetical protein